MEKQHILLLHWEALYPFDVVNNALTALKLPNEFPKNSLHIALPHDYLVQASSLLASSGFHFGCNDMLSAEPASFTQTVGARFLQETNASFVLIGKAFNRNQIQESHSAINHKIRAALAANILPFVCIGETQLESEEGRTADVIKKQLSECLASLSPEDIQRIHFVYDTPTTISSLSQVTAKDLNEAYESCRQQFETLFEKGVADSVNILCALPSYNPIYKDFFENTPFSGYYFRMIDANLSPLLQSAKDIAPLQKFVEPQKNEPQPKDADVKEVATATEAAQPEEPAKKPRRTRKKPPDEA